MFMAFWDKFFKRNNDDISHIHVQKQELINKGVDISVSHAQDIEKETYHVFFSLSTEEEQNSVRDFIRPITDKWQVMNLKLAYGVRVEKVDLFLISYRTINEREKGTGKTLYNREFVVLHNGECYKASYTSENIHDEGDLIYSVPDAFSEPLKQAMDFYRNWQLHRDFEKVCREQESSVDVNNLNNLLREPLFKEYEKYEEEQKKIKLSQRKDFEINSEADAKYLFFLCQPFHKMKEEYTEGTIKAFEQYATGEKKKEWVIEECRQVLQDIANGDSENAYDKLDKINGRCSYFLGASSYMLAEDYTKACKVLFKCGEERFVVCIHTYLSYLQNCPNPAVTKELLDMTESYYKEKYPEEYERGNIDNHPQKFKRVCCMLRGKMRELSVFNNEDGFQFVITEPEMLRKIVLWYRNKYNDDAAVREDIAELNSAYGVENEKVFLTAKNSEADSYSHRDWDRCWFVAIMKETGEVLEFRCRREAEDGGFVADYHSGSSKENWMLLSAAIEYYRNHHERKAFFDAYSAEHDGATIEDLMKSSHKGLLSKFKRHYEKEYKRINSNPLEKILLKMVDLCEEKGPVYGYKNTVIAKPATEEEITAWENEQGILLSDSYKDFLKFANGVQFFGGSEYIAGLQGLNPMDEYLGADYILMGEMIGDGTMIGMSKSDGHVYIADHGEYEDKGDFVEFMEYFLGFLEGI